MTDGMNEEELNKWVEDMSSGDQVHINHLESLFKGKRLVDEAEWQRLKALENLQPFAMKNKGCLVCGAPYGHGGLMCPDMAVTTCKSSP